MFGHGKREEKVNNIPKQMIAWERSQDIHVQVLHDFVAEVQLQAAFSSSPLFYWVPSRDPIASSKQINETFHNSESSKTPA